MRLSFNGRVEIALDADLTQGPGAWTWTDVTSYVKTAGGGIRSTAGRSDGYTQTPPQSMGLTVDNSDGRWVARNAMSPWFGRIRRTTPIRWLADSDNNVTVVTETFSYTSAAGWLTSDSGDLWDNSGSSGGTISATDYSVSSGTGKHSVPAVSSYRTSLNSGVDVDQDVTLTVTCPLPTGGNLEPGGILLRVVDPSTDYYLCRTQVLTTGAIQVVVFRNTALGGSVTLVPATTVPSITHSAGTALNIRAQTYGSTIRMRVWQGASEPIGYWHAQVADTNPIDEAGAFGVRSGVGAGNTNSKPVVFTYDNITVAKLPIRFAGYIDELPVSYTDDPLRSRVRITASGIFRRLGQSAAVVASPVTLHYLNRYDTAPVAYWPMEDASGSSVFASALGDSPAGYSDMSPAASSAFQGSKPLPTLGANPSFGGKVAPYATPSTAQFGIRFCAVIGGAPSTGAVLVGWTLLNNLIWQVQVNTLGQMKVAAIATTGPGAASDLIATAPVSIAAYYGKPLVVRVDAIQSGSVINYGLYVAVIDTSIAGYSPVVAVGGNTSSSFVCGNVSTVFIGSTGGVTQGWTVGQIAVFDDITAGVEDNSFNGYGWETAPERVSFVCQDQLLQSATADDTTGRASRMGPRPNSTALGIMQDAANTDFGILHEENYGVRYMSRYERYNRPVDMTLSWKLGQITDLSATDDDQGFKNDITVTRPGGSSFRSFNEDNILETGVVYADSITINLRDDSELEAQADFRVGVGSSGYLRWPTVKINLARSPELLPFWKKCRVGSRIQLLDVPPDLPQDVVDLEIQGWSEDIDPGQNTWTVNLYCTSASPWQVYTVEGTGNYGRLDSVQTLNAGVSATATSLSVVTPAGSALWKTGATSVDVEILGERITVTNVTGSSSPQTATVTRSVNGVVKALTAGAYITLWRGSGVAL